MKTYRKSWAFNLVFILVVSLLSGSCSKRMSGKPLSSNLGRSEWRNQPSGIALDIEEYVLNNTLEEVYVSGKLSDCDIGELVFKGADALTDLSQAGDSQPITESMLKKRIPFFKRSRAKTRGCVSMCRRQVDICLLREEKHLKQSIISKRGITKTMDRPITLFRLWVSQKSNQTAHTFNLSEFRNVKEKKEY